MERPTSTSGGSGNTGTSGSPHSCCAGLAYYTLAMQQRGAKPLCFGLSYGKEGAIATDTSQLLPPSTEVYQFVCVGFTAHEKQQGGKPGSVQLPYCEGIEMITYVEGQQVARTPLPSDARTVAEAAASLASSTGHAAAAGATALAAAAPSVGAAVGTAVGVAGTVGAPQLQAAVQREQQEGWQGQAGELSQQQQLQQQRRQEQHHSHQQEQAQQQRQGSGIQGSAEVYVSADETRRQQGSSSNFKVFTSAENEQRQGSSGQRSAEVTTSSDQNQRRQGSSGQGGLKEPTPSTSPGEGQRRAFSDRLQTRMWRNLGAMQGALRNEGPLRVRGFESSQQLYDRFWEVGGNNVIRLQRAAALASTMLVEQCEAAFQLMNNRTRAGSSGNGAAQDVGRPRNGKP